MMLPEYQMTDSAQRNEFFSKSAGCNLCIFVKTRFLGPLHSGLLRFEMKELCDRSTIDRSPVISCLANTRLIDRTMIAIAILAAGRGTRMKSDLPKVLHELGGRTLVERVLNSCQEIEVSRRLVIVGYRSELVK